jgi:hypothetical protein
MCLRSDDDSQRGRLWSQAMIQRAISPRHRPSRELSINHSIWIISSIWDDCHLGSSRSRVCIWSLAYCISSCDYPTLSNWRQSGRYYQRNGGLEDVLLGAWQYWAADQETSNNFCSQSLLRHVISNGLNHQIEHHYLLLNACHLHLIAPVSSKRVRNLASTTNPFLRELGETASSRNWAWVY